MKSMIRLLLLSMLIFTVEAEASFARAFVSKIIVAAGKYFDGAAPVREIIQANSRFVGREKAHATSKNLGFEPNGDSDNPFDVSISVDPRHKRAARKLLLLVCIGIKGRSQERFFIG